MYDERLRVECIDACWAVDIRLRVKAPMVYLPVIHPHMAILALYMRRSATHCDDVGGMCRNTRWHTRSCRGEQGTLQRTGTAEKQA